MLEVHTAPQGVAREGHGSVWLTRWSTLREGCRVTLGIVLVPRSFIPVSKYPLHPCPRPPPGKGDTLLTKQAQPLVLFPGTPPDLSR